MKIQKEQFMDLDSKMNQQQPPNQMTIMMGGGKPTDANETADENAKTVDKLRAAVAAACTRRHPRAASPRRHRW